MSGCAHKFLATRLLYVVVVSASCAWHLCCGAFHPREGVPYHKGECGLPAGLDSSRFEMDSGSLAKSVAGIAEEEGWERLAVTGGLEQVFRRATNHSDVFSAASGGYREYLLIIATSIGKQKSQLTIMRSEYYSWWDQGTSYAIVSLSMLDPGMVRKLEAIHGGTPIH